MGPQQNLRENCHRISGLGSPKGIKDDHYLLKDKVKFIENYTAIRSCMR